MAWVSAHCSIAGAGGGDVAGRRSGATSATRVSTSARASTTQPAASAGSSGRSLRAAEHGLHVVVPDHPASAAGASPVAAATAPSTIGRGGPGQLAAIATGGVPAAAAPRPAPATSRASRALAVRAAQASYTASRPSPRRRCAERHDRGGRLGARHRRAGAARGTPARPRRPAASAGSSPPDWVWPATGRRASASSRAGRAASVIRTSSRAGPAAARGGSGRRRAPRRW